MIKLRLFIIAIALLIVNTLHAKSSDLPLLKTETKTIAIFKNGLGFFMREGRTSLKNGWAVTEHVPAATLGSLWIASLDKGSSLEEAISFMEMEKKATNAISINELLKANINEYVTITYGDKTIRGKIKSVPEDRTYPQPLNQYNYRRGNSRLSSITKSSAIVILSTKDGDIVLNKNSITKVVFNGKYNTKYEREEDVKKIKFKIKTTKDRAELLLSYLQKGIMWTPSYILNIEDPKEARITMKATVMNDIEDMNNVNLFFVVGYPNFLYSNISSPLAMTQSVQEFINSLNSKGRDSGRYDGFANVMAQSMDYRAREEAPSADYGYSTVDSTPGASEQDLFLYNKKNITLKKGERAYYHIFSSTVKYKHIYKWEIPDTSKVNQTGYMRSGSSSRKKIIEQVWHSVKLENSTEYPWTTAPAFVVAGSKPIAQDVINYTPKSSDTDLRLTIAVDIKTDRKEEEIERDRDVKLYRRSYDKITVKGELYIKNLKNKDIDMEIRKNLTGEVIKVSDNGKIKKIAESLSGVNYNSIITWEIPLKKGEEKKLTYRYTIYVHH